MSYAFIRPLKNPDGTVLVSFVETVPRAGAALGAIFDTEGFLKFGAIANFDAQTILDKNEAEVELYPISITEQVLKVFLDGYDLAQMRV